MIHRATNLIADYFEQVGIPCKVREIADRNLSEVETGFSRDEVKNVIVHFLSNSDKTDVSVRVFKYGDIRITPSNRGPVLQALNHMNNRFRFAKFEIHTDNTIIVEYDLPQETEEDDVGKVCREILVRFQDILDRAYPEISDAAMS